MPKPNVVCLHLLSLPVCVRLCPCLCVSPYLFYLSIRDATSDLICSSRANWNLYSASRCGHCPRWKGDSPFLSPPLFGNVMNFMLLPPPVQKSIFLPTPTRFLVLLWRLPTQSFSSSIANLSANLWQGNDIIRRLNSSSHTSPPLLFQICTKMDFRGTPSYLSSTC